MCIENLLKINRGSCQMNLGKVFFSQPENAKHRVPTSLVPRLLWSTVIIFFNHLNLKNALPLSLWYTVGIRMNNQREL